MTWPALLVLVRHGESVGNLLTVDDRAAHETATHAYPLTELGKTQAKLAGEKLRKDYGYFDYYYTSYYERARQTMDIMYPGVKVYEDARLAEAQRGIYHTLTRAEIEKKYPEEIARKNREGLYHYRPWGGENWADVEMRVHSFLGTLARDYVGKNVLMVVHGHWLLLFNRLIEHTPIDEAVKKYEGHQICDNCGINIYQGGYRLKQIECYTPWDNKGNSK